MVKNNISTEHFFDEYSKEYGKNRKKKFFSKNHRVLIDNISFDSDFPVVLDVGTGPGDLLKLINSVKPTAVLNGVDISQKMLEMAKKNIPQANFYKGKADKLPFKDSSVDIITCVASFHHYEDPGAALNEFYRVLKPNGRVYILDSVRDAFPFSFMAYYWDLVDSRFSYSRHLFSRDIISFTEEAGFRKVFKKWLLRPYPVLYSLIQGRK